MKLSKRSVYIAFAAANSDIVRLKGTRFVTSVKPNDGVRINEGLLKQLTGEDTVTARRVYKCERENLQYSLDIHTKYQDARTV